MLELLNINTIMITIGTYSLSYLEFFGTIFGLISVILASRANILTWPTGIINEFFFFILFFQVQLYANMFLQLIFFITTLYGWYRWRSPTKELPISHLSLRWITPLIIIAMIGTFLFTAVIANLHLWLPKYFPEASASAFFDALIVILSLIATLLMALKKIECWIVWMLNNIICIGLYFEQGILFMALEYLLFFVIAAYGYYGWFQNKKSSD